MLLRSPRKHSRLKQCYSSNTSGKDWWNRCVFRRWQKIDKEADDWISGGREFQRIDAATRNERRPAVARRYVGSSWWSDVVWVTKLYLCVWWKQGSGTIPRWIQLPGPCTLARHVWSCTSSSQGTRCEGGCRFSDSRLGEFGMSHDVSSVLLSKAQFPFKCNRVRCVNENRKKRKLLRRQAANHGCQR